MVILRFLIVIFLSLASPVLSASGADIEENAEQSSLIADAHEDAHTEILEELSAEEQEWYDKFQNGLMFFSGWKQISEEILTSVPPEQTGELQQLLDIMGVRIGAEWSKANNERRINNEQLQSWGSRLRKARRIGAEELAVTIRKITGEVNDILDIELDKVAAGATGQDTNCLTSGEANARDFPLSE